jgi:hypothetical protein
MQVEEVSKDDVFTIKQAKSYLQITWSTQNGVYGILGNKS